MAGGVNMELSNAQRAEVLVRALPYIQKYNGKIIVVKYGGNAMVSDELKNAVMRDIVLLSLIGVKVVLVHGGGPEISETLKKMGKTSEFVGGLRVTDVEHPARHAERQALARRGDDLTVGVVGAQPGGFAGGDPPQFADLVGVLRGGLGVVGDLGGPVPDHLG